VFTLQFNSKEEYLFLVVKEILQS